MDYEQAYKDICKALASNTFKEVDAERLRQYGFSLLKEDAANPPKAAAKATSRKK